MDKIPIQKSIENGAKLTLNPHQIDEVATTT
jgi:hypothetical protein